MTDIIKRLKSLSPSSSLNEHTRACLDAIKEIETLRAGSPETENVRNAFMAAIDFSLSNDCDEGCSFLTFWREGDWQTIAKDFPEFDLSTTGDTLAIKVQRDVDNEVIARCEDCRRYVKGRCDDQDLKYLIAVAKRGQYADR